MDLKSFYKIFGFPELLSIVKNWYAMVLILVVSYFSLWSIGFSNASRDHLAEKMKSPFVEYLSIEIPYKFAKDSIQFLDAKLQDTSFQKRYGLEDWGYIRLYSPYFYKNSQEVVKSYLLSTAQVAGEDDAFLKHIRSSENKLLVKGNPNMDKNPWSVIVTTDFLKRLDYSIEDLPSYINLNLDHFNGQRGFPLAIGGVVKRLPNNVDLLIKPALYQALTSSSQKDNPLWLNHSDYSNVNTAYFDTSSVSVNSSLVLDSLLKVGLLARDSSTHKYPYDGFLINLSDPSVNEISKLLSLNLENLIEVFDPNKVSFILKPLEGDKEKLMVKIKTLSKVDAFESWCKKKGLFIDMSDIEDTKNFQLFSTLCKVLALFLSLVCIAFVVTTLSRTIIHHIVKNSKNLGTLKAFGLSNTNILITYSCITAIIVLLTFSLSYILVTYLGPKTSTLITNQLSIKVPELFKLSLSVDLVLYFILIPITVIIITLNHKIKGVTPGDLIYERN